MQSPSCKKKKKNSSHTYGFTYPSLHCLSVCMGNETPAEKFQRSSWNPCTKVWVSVTKQCRDLSYSCPLLLHNFQPPHICSKPLELEILCLISVQPCSVFNLAFHYEIAVDDIAFAFAHTKNLQTETRLFFHWCERKKFI